MMDDELAITRAECSTELEVISHFAVDQCWSATIARCGEGWYLYLRRSQVELRLKYCFDDWVGRWEFSSAHVSRVGDEGCEPRYEIAPDCIQHVILHPHDLDMALP